MDKLAELSDEDVKSGLMDLDDMTKSEMSLDQLPELPMSSLSSECIVEKIKKKNAIVKEEQRIILGKTSTRSVWKKGEKGRRYKKNMLKNACGGFAKKFLKKLRYKRLMTIRANSKDKNAAKKLLNKDLRRDSDFKEKFERANRETAHLRAGGQSRISHLKESVKENDS